MPRGPHADLERLTRRAPRQLVFGNALLDLGSLIESIDPADIRYIEAGAVAKS
jgi:hypothetical protein